MPRYDFHCSSCGKTFESFEDMGQGETACQCGRPAKRVFSVTTNFIFPEYMKSHNDLGRWKHREWMNKPETKKKIMDGALAFDRCDDGR